MNIGIANSAEVDAIWPIISERIAESCRKTGGDVTPGQLWQICRSGNAFLVVASDEDKILTCVIVAFEKWDKPVLRCVAIAGWEMNEWLIPVFEYVCKMGRDNGAELFVFDGRDGWGSVLPGIKRLRSTFGVEL